MTNSEKNVGIVITPNFSDRYIFKNEDYFKKILEKHFKKSMNVKIEINQSLKEYSKVDELFENLKDIKKNNNWDYTFFITDLLIRDEEEIVTIEYKKKENIALISLPMFIKLNFKNEIAEFIKQIIHYFEDDSKHSIEKINKMSKYIKKDRDERFLLKATIPSHIKLMFSMAILNHPFAVLGSLAGIIAIAFSTGSFGLVFSTMWNLALNFSTTRLSITSVIAVIGLTIWIIILHNLWVPKRDKKRDKHRLRLIYNSVTVLTLFSAMTIFYIVLFSLFFIATVSLLPKDFLFNQLDLPSDHSRFLYVKIAWFAASISTFAGAIGAGFESHQELKKILFQYPYKDEPKKSTEE